MEAFAAALAVIIGVSAAALVLTRAHLSRRAKRILVASSLAAGLVALLVWRPVSATEWRLGFPLSYARAELRIGTMIAKPRPFPAAPERAFVDFAAAASVVQLLGLGITDLIRRRR